MDYSNQDSSDLSILGKRVRKKFQLKKSAKESIEPEEIFLDAEVSDSVLDERKLETPIKRRTFFILFLIVIFGLAGLVGRTFWLQVLRGKDYNFLAERNRIRVAPDLSPRGIIYDKFMQPLVVNVPSFDLTVIPQALPRDKKNLLQTIEKLAKFLELSAGTLAQELNKVNVRSIEPLLLFSNIDLEKAQLIEAQAKDLPGFEIEKNSIREYIFAPYFAHILGYTGKIRPQDIINYPDYFLTERIGQAGLEMQYQTILRGQPGKKEVEVDAFGKIVKQISDIQLQPGENLILNIDSDLQRKLYDTLRKTLNKESKGAAGIVIDPRDGKILAFVSLPSFDNNLFIKGISSEELDELTKDPSQPFFNRVISGQYPPGSIIKPLVASAALQERIISPTTTVNCQGGITIPSNYQPDIFYNFLDWKSHGIVNVYSALAQSCNVFFYSIGGGYDRQDGLGPEGLAKYFKLFNLGTKADIDLPGEADGFIPTPDWKKEQKNETWYIGNTYHLAIGQGDLLVTPLQVAVLSVAIANDGILWQPQLLEKVVDSDNKVIKEFFPQLISKNFIDSNYLKVVREGMRQVVTNGTAPLLNRLGVKVAGKTGTAQTGSKTKPHAWFTGFAPYDKPEIVITILVENGGEGTVTAVPAVYEVLNWYFSRR